MIEIKEGVPPPKRFGSELSQTIAKMKVGQYIDVIDCPNTARIYYAARILKVAVTLERQDARTIRVWRVKE